MLNIDGVRRIAENRIREADEEGKFDNLPGMGRPISFTDDSVVPPTQRAAVKLLKNAGVLPEWAQLQRDIMQEQRAVTLLPDELAQAAARFASKEKGSNTDLATRYTEWRTQQRDRFASRVKACNHMVLKLCMVGPQHAVVVHPLNTRQLLEEFDQLVPLHIDSSQLPTSKPTSIQKQVRWLKVWHRFRSVFRRRH